MQQLWQCTSYMLPRISVQRLLAAACWCCQVFTSIAKDVMQRLQQEQDSQQQLPPVSPLKLTSTLDKQRRKKGACCSS
jgi:hypothetical protein